VQKRGCHDQIPVDHNADFTFVGYGQGNIHHQNGVRDDVRSHGVLGHEVIAFIYGGNLAVIFRVNLNHPNSKGSLKTCKDL